MEFQEKKNKLMAQRKDIEEKLSDFEQKGNRWLGLIRNWFLQANQATNIVVSENVSGMKQFLKTIGSNRRIVGGRFAVTFAKPFHWLHEVNAERQSREANQSPKSLNLKMWTHGESNPALIHAMDA